MGVMNLPEYNYSNSTREIPWFSKLTLLVLFLSLSLGRWGSYIAIVPGFLYLFDTLLLISVVGTLMKSFKKTSNWIIYTSVGFFIIYNFVRSLEFNTGVVIRDLAPFLYLFLIPTLRTSMAKIEIEMLGKVIVYATCLHLMWFLPSSVGLLKPTQVSIAEIPIFSNRSDHSGVVMCMGVAFLGIVLTQFPFRKALMLIFSLAVIVSNSRASLLGLLVVYLYIIFIQTKSKQSNGVGGFLSLLLLFAALITPLTSSPSLQSLLPENSVMRRLGFVEQDSNAHIIAQGTIRDRVLAWQSLTTWSRDQSNLFTGVGPGVEMLIESGSLIRLSGNQDVRSPHNWLVSVFSRYGISGILIWSFIVFGPIMKKQKKPQMKALKVSVVSLCVIALFGVIIESPFGSLPLAVILAKLYDDESR